MAGLTRTEWTILVAGAILAILLAALMAGCAGLLNFDRKHPVKVKIPGTDYTAETDASANRTNNVPERND